MNKNNLDSDYLSINEFANFVGISAWSLRYYDRKGVFSPAKRGTTSQNKYRYYSALQITTVKMLRVLKYIGVPLSTIKKLAENRTPEKMLKLLSKNRDRVASEIRFLQNVYSVICTFIELINEGISAIEDEISIIEMPEKRIVLGNMTDFHEDASFMKEFLCFCNETREPALNLSFPIGGYWEDMAEFLEAPSRPMRFFSVDPSGVDRKPAGLYLTGYTRGYYGQTNDLPQQMAEFAKKNGLIFSGPVYNIYLSDEISEADPDQYLLQISASVKETRLVPSRGPQWQFKHE